MREELAVQELNESARTDCRAGVVCGPIDVPDRNGWPTSMYFRSRNRACYVLGAIGYGHRAYIANGGVDDSLSYSIGNESENGISEQEQFDLAHRRDTKLDGVKWIGRDTWRYAGDDRARQPGQALEGIELLDVRRAARTREWCAESTIDRAPYVDMGSGRSL